VYPAEWNTLQGRMGQLYKYFNDVNLVEHLAVNLYNHYFLVQLVLLPGDLV